jgi:hypothetical protein
MDGKDNTLRDAGRERDPFARCLSTAIRRVALSAAPNESEKFACRSEHACFARRPVVLGLASDGVVSRSRAPSGSAGPGGALALDATFALGDAGSLPVEDGVADVVLSVFGVIFAPDASAAAGEMVRVTSQPGGSRSVRGCRKTRSTMRSVLRKRQSARRSAPPPPGPAAVRMARPGRAARPVRPIRLRGHNRGTVPCVCGESPRDYVNTESANHPLAVAGRAVLEPRGEAEALRGRMLSIYEAANEVPDGFRVTSRYVVATARRT